MNVPKLRFLNFNNDYEIKEISDITYNVSSGKISKQLEDGEYNVYGSMGIIGKSNFYDYTGEKVLVARVGANAGSVNKINEKCCISDNTLVLEPKNILNDYLYYSLSHYDPKKLIFGSGQPLVTGGQLKKIKLGVPSKEEQVKVSNFLSLLDKKIELQSKKIEDLKLFKKGLNKNIFSNLNNKFKIGDLIIEYNKKTSTNNQYKVLSSTANGIILQNEYFSKQAASSDNSGYKIVPRGYITYRSMSDTGEFHFNIQNIIEIGIVSPSYPVFTINENIVNKDYFVYYINENKSFKNKILSSKEGGTRYALSISKFRDIKLDLPSLKHQKKYSKLLMAYNKKIKQEQNKLDKLQELKKGTYAKYVCINPFLFYNSSNPNSLK